jgi:histidine ammonia-lyase
MNAATDNPLVFADSGEVISGGNFHAQPIALAADLLAAAVTDLGSICERRVENLVNPDLSGLPGFLTPHPGLNSGMMLVQVLAAALVSENRTLSFPASVDSIPTSANQEDHVSMGVTAGLKAVEVLRNVETVLAIELLCAAEGIDYRRPLRTSGPLEAVHTLIRSQVPHLDSDRALAPDIAAIAAMVRDGRLVAAAEIHPVD